MSSPKRDYFVLFDLMSQSSEFSEFHVSFFYLKTLKKKRKHSLSFISTPFFSGLVKFGLDFNEKVRPLQFEKIIGEDKSKPVNPRILKRFLLDDKNQFIAFSKRTPEEQVAPIKEMLKSFQYDISKVKTLSICQSCAEERNIKILRKNQRIMSYTGNTICAQCAVKNVIKQARLKGVIERDEKLNPKLKNFFNHMILRFKDVKKVLSTFNPDFDPTKNKEITLYDVEESKQIAQKYLNQMVDHVSIPDAFKAILRAQKIRKLLPIQALSIENGLLTEQASQLIMAPTSGGKTLIGEMAGITKLLTDKKQKMLYLVPIVALANVRTEEFERRYKPLKLNILKRVGESLFEVPSGDRFKNLKEADIIIGTYEAIDYILRSGQKDTLGQFETIIIDEIQTLIDEERGYLLDGFIARLKTIYPEAQYLYLSATIGEPRVLAKKLQCKLIEYNNRPVPIERHLILCQNETFKHKVMMKLTRAAFSRKSKFGFKGQTIIFTNTRKKCEALAEYLQNNYINAAPYHSGLTNEERKVIEKRFQAQKIAAVVSTAALAAGVDFPAKQVIFESLSMGIKWLTVAEFEQMLGRAGRLGKHERGGAYLLVQPGKIYTPRMKKSEEDIAIRLLNGKIRDFELLVDENRYITELLAFLSMASKSVSMELIHSFYNHVINDQYELERFLKKLHHLNLIRIKEDYSYKITGLGRSIAKSFLTLEEALRIIEIIKNQRGDLIEIVLELKPLRNVYLAKKIVADLSQKINRRFKSNNLFSASVLSLMNAENIKPKRGNFSSFYITFFTNLINDIFNCSCDDNPYCDCGRINLERMILSLRTKDQMSIEEIQEYLEQRYHILVFKGDLIDYFENLIYSFESIKNIAEGIPNIDPEYKEELNSIPKIIERIKG